MRIAVRVVLAALLAALLAGMVCAGGLYYWHFKTERALRYLEDQGPEAKLQPEMLAALDEAGCRALPSLVRATRPERPPGHLHEITSQIVRTMNGDHASKKEDCDLRAQRRSEFRVETDDPKPVIAAKCARVQDWWAQHGSEVHQWWRFWTGSCRPAP